MFSKCQDPKSNTLGLDSYQLLDISVWNFQESYEMVATSKWYFSEVTGCIRSKLPKSGRLRTNSEKLCIAFPCGWSGLTGNGIRAHNSPSLMRKEATIVSIHRDRPSAEEKRKHWWWQAFGGLPCLTVFLSSCFYTGLVWYCFCYWFIFCFGCSFSYQSINHVYLRKIYQVYLNTGEKRENMLYDRANVHLANICLVNPF